MNVKIGGAAAHLIDPEGTVQAGVGTPGGGGERARPFPRAKWAKFLPRACRKELSPDKIVLKP